MVSGLRLRLLNTIYSTYATSNHVSIVLRGSTFCLQGIYIIFTTYLTSLQLLDIRFATNYWLGFLTAQHNSHRPSAVLKRPTNAYLLLFVLHFVTATSLRKNEALNSKFAACVSSLFLRNCQANQQLLPF